MRAEGCIVWSEVVRYQSSTQLKSLRTRSSRDRYHDRSIAMDQEPLVIEQIEAGRKFIGELDKYLP
jgi:hypothetical protein